MVYGLARDDVASLRLRTKGLSLVCAMLISTDPPTIRDNAGVLVIPPVPSNCPVNENDVCLFLFDCTPRPPVCKRVTVIPSALVPLYLAQLKQYRDKIEELVAQRDLNRMIATNAMSTENVLMGVAWIFEYGTPGTAKQTANELERLLEAGGAEPLGSYTVDCLPYTPTTSNLTTGIQINYVLHHSNYPQSSFSIAPADIYKTSPRAICDRGFDLILTKMSAGLTPDSAGKFELSGQEYRLRDFVVRIGTASQVTTVKGVIVEIDYEPSQVASQAVHMLSEFVNQYFPIQNGKKPEIIDKKTPEQYTAIDTLYQYLCIFRTMRNRTWLFRVTASEKSCSERFRSLVFSSLRSLPWVRKRFAADMERARLEIEDDTHQWDKLRDFYKFLPERSIPGDDIVAEARQYACMGERRFMEHYDPRTRTEDARVCAQVYDLFSHSDPHRSDAFPGARKMESEILRMSCSMFHGGADSCGVIASGGTEALLLACLAYRNRALSSGALRPEVVAPSTAHPALDKAAQLFGLRVRRVPVDADDKADVSAIQRAIRHDTCMIVVSAPNHITGTTDPIEKLAELALSYGIPLHVDCTLGGFLLPFMEYCDFIPPSFDFRLPGVTSISIDLHRYGQCPRSCSVLMYREPSMLRHQCFTMSEWSGGCYATPTLAGGRDGGAISTAWATLLRKGREGYLDACHRVVEATRRLADLLIAVPGIELKGAADVCIVAFTTQNINIYALVDRMIRRGWHVDALRSPVAARVSVTLSMCEEGHIEALVTDLEESMRFLEDNPGWIKASKLASFYHMLNAVADRSVVDELQLLRMHAHYSIPAPLERRQLRSLSVEGRKMSMIAAADAVKALARLRARQEKEEKTAVHSAAI